MDTHSLTEDRRPRVIYREIIHGTGDKSEGQEALQGAGADADESHL